MHALTIHAQHRSDDRARDAPLSRVHHHRTDHARRTRHGHAAHGTALGRVGHGRGSGRRSTSASREGIRRGSSSWTATELEWQRARYREGRHLFAPADPVLVGLNTLQHWLWNRIGSPHGGSRTRKRIAAVNNGPGPRGRAHLSEGHHEHRSQDSPQRTTDARWQAGGRRDSLHRGRARRPQAHGLRGVGAARRHRPQRHVSGAPVHRARRPRNFALLRAIGDPNAQNRCGTWCFGPTTRRRKRRSEPRRSRLQAPVPSFVAAPAGGSSREPDSAEWRSSCRSRFIGTAL